MPTQPQHDMVIVVERSEEDRVPLRKVLRADLNGARKARDSELVTLIRTLIAAIDNAEAVDTSDALDGRSEVPRRSLSNVEVVSVILAEGADLRVAADDYERHGNCTEAERLRALALVADRYADQMPGGRT